MPKFSFIARDKVTGKKITGIEESAGKEILIASLQARGLIVTDVSSDSKELKFKKKVTPTLARRSHLRINYRDLSIF